MKIAVVGSGISGLTAAYYLSQSHQVHVFEAEDRPGGHTHTVDVASPAGPRAVDTGFIVFNDWTYPRFMSLMDELGVASQPSDMSFSVKDAASGLEYNGTDMNGLFAQRGNLLRPDFLRMVRDILRFNRRASADADKLPPDLSLGEYLARGKYGPLFVNNYIVPMGAAVWSSPAGAMDRFPAAFFLRFFKNHGMLSVNKRPVWRVLEGGSRSYIGPLTASFRDRLHLDAKVTSVRRVPGGVELALGGRRGGETFQADQAVLAGHADQMLAALSDASPAEREVLSAFPYRPNETLLHSDPSVMPDRRRAWAAWNYFSPAEPGWNVAVTYWMNKLQGLEGPQDYFVSLNSQDRVNPKSVIKRILYHHPVFTREGVAAQARWAEISGRDRIHFCGAYWRNGFHEDGVVSALRVCGSLWAKM